jgi:bacterioferritin (cytochrome b1)
MDPSIKGALIGALASLLVCLINNYFQRAAVDKQNNATIMLINYQIEELKKEVTKHNNLIERVYKLEEKTSIHDAELNRVNHRLNDLENDGR